MGLENKEQAGAATHGQSVPSSEDSLPGAEFDQGWDDEAGAAAPAEESETEAAAGGDAGEKPTPEKEEGENEAEAGAEAEGEKPEGEEGSEGKPKKEGKPEKTKLEAAEELAQKLNGGEPAPETKPEPAPPKKEEKKVEPPAKPGALALLEVPEGEFEVNGEKMSFKQFAEEFPESAAFAQAMASQAVNQAVGQIMGEAKALQEQVAQMAYWGSLTELHPDAKKISRDPAFVDWLKKQSKGIQHLSLSGDPEHAAAVLDAYKEQGARSKVKEIDKAAADKKKRRDDLHGHTLKSKPAAPGAKKEDQDDFAAGFDS